MLAKRVIPCLDVHDGQVTRGVRFGRAEVGELRNVGDPVSRGPYTSESQLSVSITADRWNASPLICAMIVSFTGSWPEVETDTTMANPRMSHALLMSVRSFIAANSRFAGVRPASS